MSFSHKLTFVKLFQVVSVALMLNGFVYGQSLETKLAQKATFIPNDPSGLEQLIAIAQHLEVCPA